MITDGSRYAESTVIPVTVGRHTRQVIVPGPENPYTFVYQTYLVTGDDRPDTLAWMFYGDPTEWWHIADANPSILDWSTMPVGQIIMIPET